MYVMPQIFENRNELARFLQVVAGQGEVEDYWTRLVFRAVRTDDGSELEGMSCCVVYKYKH